jgi:hypothetical protein
MKYDKGAAATPQGDLPPCDIWGGGPSTAAPQGDFGSKVLTSSDPAATTTYRLRPGCYYYY